jgi:hypothetical protein
MLLYSEVAIEQVRQAFSMSSDSMTGYQALQGYVLNLVPSLSAVEEESSDQRLNLTKFLEQVRDKTWIDIKLDLSTLVALFLPFCALISTILLQHFGHNSRKTGMAKQGRLSFVYNAGPKSL